MTALPDITVALFVPGDRPERFVKAASTDAEAIINDLQNLVIAENQRKQQLEEDRDTWKARAEFSYAQRDKQSAALKLARAGLITYGCSTDIETCDCDGCKALAAIDAPGE